MIKKPSQFYDDLVVVGGNPKGFRHTEFPLIVVIASPSGFFSDSFPYLIGGRLIIFAC